MTPPLILGIDPGPTTSGVVLYDPLQPKVLRVDAKMPTPLMLDMLRKHWLYDEPVSWHLSHVTLAVERVVSYGKNIGKTTIGTIEVIGRLLEMWEGRTCYAISRPDILAELTGNRSCSEGGAFARLCELHGGDNAVGTKKAPGPLYGVGSHARSALAVAVVAAQRIEKGIAP